MKRRVLYIPEPTGAGIVRLRKVEVPATGLDAIPELAARIEQQLRRLEKRYGLPSPTPRRTRQ
jgi:hypothetical protein